MALYGGLFEIHVNQDQALSESLFNIKPNPYADLVFRSRNLDSGRRETVW